MHCTAVLCDNWHMTITIIGNIGDEKVPESLTFLVLNALIATAAIASVSIFGCLGMHKVVLSLFVSRGRASFNVDLVR